MAAKYIECAGYATAGDWDAMRANCIDPDVVAHHVDDRDINGADGFLQALSNMKTAFPDLKVEPQLVLSNGRNLMVISMITGTHRGALETPMGDIPATNKNIGQLYFQRIALTDDVRALEEWWYLDPATQLGQLGKLPVAMKTRKPVHKGIEGAPIIVSARDDEKERANLKTVAKWNELFSDHKLDELMTLYAENAIESDRAEPADWKGKREIRRGNQKFFSAFSDGRLEQPALFAIGDYVVSVGRFTGTNDGNFDGIKKTGKQVTVSYAEVIELENGKIAQVWRFRNGLAMANQLGLLQEPSKKQKSGT
jgi:predicted ester cyclase